MRKTSISILLGAVIGALLLVACSGVQLPGTTASSTSQTGQASQTGQPNGGPNFANMSLEEKLSIGTLKLEGTDKAIKADEAKTLLPLWKAVKTESSSTTASSAEVSALYKQIEEAMTADQLKAIKDLTLSGTDMQALMTQYNIQAPQGGPNGGTRPTQSAQSGNSSSSSSSANAAGGPGGDPGGMPPDGDPGGGMPGDMGGGQTGAQASAQGTPQAGQRPAGGPGRSGGMSMMFVDPVIQLLEQRASS